MEPKNQGLRVESTLSAREEEIARHIVECAYIVHDTLGPGLLEHVYEVCLCHELTRRGLHVNRQVPVPLVYDGISFDEAFRADVLVEDLVICEIKAVEKLVPIYKFQVLTHLKLTNRRLGFLINFNSPLLKDGIRRIVR